jgi:hypothetical protein
VIKEEEFSNHKSETFENLDVSNSNKKKSFKNNNDQYIYNPNEPNILETEHNNHLIIDGRLIKAWEMNIDDLAELEDEILMNEEFELDPEMKDYVHERNFSFFI